jgi:NACHT domain
MPLTSSSIIQDIREKCDSGLALVGYYFFDFRDTTKQDVRGLLASLLSHLCAKSDSCYDILSELYSKNNAGSQQPNNNSLTECLKKMIQLPQQPMIYIIVDALDECPNSSGFPSTAREKVLDLLEDLLDLNLPNLRICVTSRPEADIRDVLEHLTSHHISLHDESGQKNVILDYINTIVQTDRKMRRWRSEDKQLVIDTLSGKVDGM